MPRASACAEALRRKYALRASNVANYVACFLERDVSLWIKKEKEGKEGERKIALVAYSVMWITSPVGKSCANHMRSRPNCAR